jgi:tRNA dimethylallyltransferase
MASPELPQLVAIIGPTAVGKTELSLDLAESLNAEILSVDSRQVYRQLDIGTAKATRAERERIPHHLIDVAEPTERFSASRFVELARTAIDGIRSRGKTALLVGGTPFYFRALLSNALTGNLASDPAIRFGLEESLRREGKEEMHRRLRILDEETAARIHPNDTVRVVRALEIHALTGRPPSEVFRTRAPIAFPARTLYIGLNRNREEIRERICLRALQQFENGFPEEVASLLEKGIDERYPSMQGLGYRELVAFNRGLVPIEKAMEGYIRATCAFARRQMTWFSKFEPAVWYDMTRSEGESLQGDILRKIAESQRGGRI